MPLVVPGLMSKDGSSSGGDDWMSKLAGKKIGESHDETVRALIPPPRPLPTTLPHHLTIPVPAPRFPNVATVGFDTDIDMCKQTFAKTDLPKEHRILKPDSMKTMDFKPDRLNIHVTNDGTVEKVSQG